MGANIIKGITRKIEFVCTVHTSHMEAFMQTAKFLSENTIANPLKITTEIESELSKLDRANLIEKPELLALIEADEADTVRLIVQSYFKADDATRFTDIIQTIMVALHQNGFPLSAACNSSNMFGFLKE